MVRIRGLFLFYRSFFLKPGLLLTTIGCCLYYKNAKYALSVGPPVFLLKAIVFATTAYIVYRSKKLYYYYNLQLSYFTLVLTAFVLDFFLFFTCLKMTKYLLS
ncbi:hypothetical protein SAMN05216311_12016 [Chitinophaga sp. CF418]|nr:hypothetical protein SAMN05216311_12016 [Chitinophaga sp. CF418]